MAADRASSAYASLLKLTPKQSMGAHIPSKRALPTYEEALERIFASTRTAGVEIVSQKDALGRVLRAPVRADRDQPAFDRATMDGFAVRTGDITPGRPIPIAGTILAGAPQEDWQCPLSTGKVVRIATGAPLPPGADAVIPIEKAVVDESVDPPHVQFKIEHVKPWLHIHPQGADARSGQVVLEPGIKLAPHHLSIAATVGATELTVARFPRISLLTSGDEVRPSTTPTHELGRQQIRNSNGPALVAMLRAIGAPVSCHVHVPDDKELTIYHAAKALSESDLIVTVGGVSVGSHDLWASAWQALGMTTILHGVAIQPGKPLLVVQTPEGNDVTLIVGLPGNPVSVLATAHLFLVPVIGQMLGISPATGSLRWRRVELAADVKASPARQLFRAATLDDDLRAHIIDWHGSGDLMHTDKADGFVRLPVTDQHVAAGTRVPYMTMVV